jgi:hypothetical protein
MNQQQQNRNRRPQNKVVPQTRSEEVMAFLDHMGVEMKFGSVTFHLKAGQVDRVEINASMKLDDLESWGEK